VPMTTTWTDYLANFIETASVAELIELAAARETLLLSREFNI
jgi:hypothetical protein